MQLLKSGHFNRHEVSIFDPIINSIYNSGDAWMTAADFRGYIDAQQKVSLAYQDEDNWAKMSILNTAASGRFSSDRTISEYNSDIWNRNRS